MPDPVESQLDRLHAWFGEHDSALVAFSGGVDSALLATVATRVLGKRALSCIGVSPSYPAREREAAINLAEAVGITFRLVDTEEHLDPRYAANPDNRCYFCKDDLYGRLAAIARDEGWAVVVDGTNASDLGDDRPGRTAAQEKGVRSPLVELGITKPLVRAMSKRLGLPVWDKPAMACLSSRVPHGVAITPQVLSQIEAAEDVLVALGFHQFRVRHHGELARIELEPGDLPLALERRGAIVTGIRAAGYRHVTLDLAGFRGGRPEPGVESVTLTVEGSA